MNKVATPQIKKYWQDFIIANELPHLSDYQIDFWSFGNTKDMANELGQLVLEGKKTATCSLLRAYRGHENEIPRVGLYSIICDGSDKPLCVIFLTHTWICSFNEVTEEHAYLEGEGDRSLEYWRKAHREFFNHYEGFDEEEPLVCEKFKVVHKL